MRMVIMRNAVPSAIGTGYNPFAVCCIRAGGRWQRVPKPKVPTRDDSITDNSMAIWEIGSVDIYYR
jgi:hypothetical protein